MTRSTTRRATDDRVQRCAGCGVLCGVGYASQVTARTPDGSGLLCASCADALARAVLRRGVDLVRAWRYWEGGFYSGAGRPRS